jgi:hypothetical protein
MYSARPVQSDYQEHDMEANKNSLVASLTIIDDSFDVPPAVAVWLNCLGYAAQAIALATLVAVVCFAMALSGDFRDVLAAHLTSSSTIPDLLGNGLKIAALLVAGRMMYFFWAGLPAAVRMAREGFRREMHL